MWDFSWEGAAGAVMGEFIMLGYLRKSIREVAEVIHRVRRIQLDAVTAKFGRAGRTG
jgi:hypothetical protein